MNSTRRRVSWMLNIGLILYSFLIGWLSYLVDPSVLLSIPLDEFIEAGYSKSRLAILAFVLIIMAYTFGALIIREFWNRLICRIFQIVEINFKEAFCILLIIGILQGL